MISVCGSNMLTNFPGNWVTPSKIRAWVCRTTRRTRSLIVSSRSLKWRTLLRRRAGSTSTSCNTRRESWRICRVTCSSWRYSFVRFNSPSGPLWRKAWAIAITRLLTVRIRLRTFFFSLPTVPSIRCMVRVSTRAPSFNKPLSVG